MIPVSDAPLTPQLVAELNDLALQTVKGSARFKKSSAKRRTTKRARRSRR
jgi:hypothetical protein